MRTSSFSTIMACMLLCSPAVAQQKGSTAPLPENWRRVAPWAEQPPVDIARRLAVARSLVATAGAAANAYSTALQAQADAQNQRLTLQNELDKYYLDQQAAAEQSQADRRAAELADMDRRRIAELNIETSPRSAPATAIDPSYYSFTGFTDAQASDLGVTTAQQSQASRGWGTASRDLLMLKYTGSRTGPR